MKSNSPITEYLRVFYELASDGLFLFNLEGYCIDANKAAFELGGYAWEDIIGKHYTELVIFPGNEIPKLKRLLVENKTGTVSEPDEIQIIRKDKSRGMIEMRTILVIESNETMILGIARDVTKHKKIDRDLQIYRRQLQELVEAHTAHLKDSNLQLQLEINERKEIERALQVSEQYYRALFNDAHDAILIIEPEHEIVLDVNQRACDIYGFTRDEFIGLSLEEISKDVARGKQQIEAIQKIENFHNFETVQFRKDGSEMHLEINASLVDYHGRKVIQSINRDITERKQTEIKLKQNLQKIYSILEEIIHAITMIVEMKDPYTAGHQRRVSNLANAIAEKMGLTQDKIEGIRLAALIHDIGKINVPAEILIKPGRLTSAEFSMIQTHCQAGYDILRSIDFPWPIANIALQHHERLNGSGYPRGLRMDEIPMEAKIVMVADVFEAMVSHRPYRPARSLDEAIDELTKNSGILYDGKVVDAFFILLAQKEFSLEGVGIARH